MGISIFANPYRTPCQNYVCRNISSWFVGVNGGPLNTAYTLCDSCAKHMVENLPMELMQDGPQKDKIIKQQEQAATLAAAKEALAEQLKALQVVVVEEPAEEKFEEVKQEEAPAEPTATEQLEAKTTYRCLDCGTEFTDKRGLSNHMRGKHKEE